MKGVVLAGGTGSRLYPLTKVTNKHLLPIGKKPMIYYPIEKILECNIKEILIVTGLEHMGDVVNLLGSGKEFNCNFTYKVQDEAGGIAQALGLAENFVGNDKFITVLGDNIFKDDLSKFTKEFKSSNKKAKIILKRVPDPERYGVVNFNNIGDIYQIEEKPTNPKSSYCVTGVYMYSPDVFNVIKTLKPSNRGELEITDVNNHYISTKEMSFDIINNWWTDAGTFTSLDFANKLMSNY